MSDRWINVTERKPRYGKLVYTRDDQERLGAHTLYWLAGIDVWHSRLSPEEVVIVEWLEQDESELELK